MKLKNRAWQIGFDRGNYGSAYEATDFESWWSHNCNPPEGIDDLHSYLAGLILGFFSSYEISEIPDEVAAEDVAILRADYEVVPEDRYGYDETPA